MIQLPEMQKLSRASDDDLHRMAREHRDAMAEIADIMGRLKNRAKSIQSTIDRREAGKASQHGGPPKPSPPLVEDEAPTVVTDHAIVRYLERARGIDMDEVVAEMKDRVENGERYMNGALTIHDGMIFVSRRNPNAKDRARAITTVMPENYMDDNSVSLAAKLHERDVNGRFP